LYFKAEHSSSGLSAYLRRFFFILIATAAKLFCFRGFDAVRSAQSLHCRKGYSDTLSGHFQMYNTIKNPADVVRAIDDPKLFPGQPICLRIMGRPFQDEKVVAVTDIIDRIINPK
jgi:hypothetical protein